MLDEETLSRSNYKSKKHQKQSMLSQFEDNNMDDPMSDFSKMYKQQMKNQPESRLAQQIN